MLRESTSWKRFGADCGDMMCFLLRLRSVLGFMGGADNLIDPSNLRRLIAHHIPFQNLENAPIPVHVVATNLGGATVCLSSGPAVEAILASAAIPAAFPSVRVGEHDLIDGAVGSNTPIITAATLGAARIIALPTGFACALHEPPKGAIARALHAITLLIAHQMVRDLRELGRESRCFHRTQSVPPRRLSLRFLSRRPIDRTSCGEHAEMDRRRRSVPA